MFKKSSTSKFSYIFLPLICILLTSCYRQDNLPSISTQANKTSQEKKAASNLTKQADSPQGQFLPISAQVTIKQKTINLEVAQTPQQQARGLMFREELPDNRGMFFPFAQAKLASFWMFQVPVALDMIFVKQPEKSSSQAPNNQSQDNQSIRQVVAIADSVPPCKVEPQDCPVYGPDSLVDGVIELRAGRAKELGLEAGDLVKIELLNP